MSKFSYLINQTYFRQGFKTEDRELEIGAYYPFIMKNGTKGRHKCVGLVTKNGIYITSMGGCWGKGDIIWCGGKLDLQFPPEFDEPKYL